MKFVLLFITFSGNYVAFAQNETGVPDSISSKQNKKVAVKQIIAETLAPEKTTIRLYPNPAKNKVDIDIKGFELGDILVQLLDNEGNVVSSDKRFAFSGNETIVFMFSQKAGVYYILLKQNEKTMRSRMLIR